VFSTTVSASPVQICDGDSSQLELIAYGGSGNYTYSWSSIPPGYSSSIAKPKVSPSDTTIYICATSDGTATRYDTTIVKVVFMPAAYAGEDTTLCAWMSSVPVNGTVSNARNWGWGSEGDGHFTDPYAIHTHYIPGANDKATGSVNLMLVAFAKPPCSGKVVDTKQLIIDPCTGIEDPAADILTLDINPNPAENYVNLTVSGLKEKAVLNLTGLDGTAQTNFTIDPAGQIITKKIDITGFSKGIYIVSLKTSGKILTEKLVIR
jgi:hypothetical protein